MLFVILLRLKVSSEKVVRMMLPFKTTYYLLGAIVLVFLSQVWLACTTAFNWDEFYFLSHVYDVESRTLFPHITAHVHLFKWLRALPDTLVQMQAGRWTMLMLYAFKLYLLYAILRRFEISKEAVLLGVLAYMSSFTVLRHVISFRYDGLVSFCALLALYLSLYRSLWTWYLAAVVLAGGFIISPKALFFCPSLLLIALFRKKRPIIHCVFFVLLVLGTSSIFSSWHSHFTEEKAYWAPLKGFKLEMLLSFDSFRCQQRIQFFIYWFIFNILFATQLLHGMCVSFKQRRYTSLLGFILPFTCIIFYSNSYAYFYPTILLLPVYFVATSMEALLKGAKEYRHHVAYCVLVGLLLVAAVSVKLNTHDRGYQEQLMRVARQSFPPDITYFDVADTIPYLQREAPIVGGGVALGKMTEYNIVATSSPPQLLIKNSIYFEKNVADFFSPADQKIMEQDYLHFWGPFYVHKDYEMPAQPKEEPQMIERDLNSYGFYAL